MKKLTISLVIISILVACQGPTKDAQSNKKKDHLNLTAAGATFPMPFYNLAFKKYGDETGILLTYGGIGSGGGIRSLKDRVVDFGATDAFLDDESMSGMPSEIIHVPTCIGAVVLAYNVPGLNGLKLSNRNIENIFMGEITNWNDEQLKVNNSDIDFPDLPITVVQRSDGSGTTYIFSDYLSKVSENWESSVGRGKSLKWPVGIGAKGNPGVAGTIKQTEGAIGYIGSEYAFSQNIPIALVENKAGYYISPTIESISAAAKGTILADTRIMLTNPDDPEAYPISGFTWIILYKEQNYDNRSMDQALETVTFLNWLIEEDAQALARQVNYAPLPERVSSLSKEILNSVTFNGKILTQ